MSRFCAVEFVILVVGAVDDEHREHPVGCGVNTPLVVIVHVDFRHEVLGAGIFHVHPAHYIVDQGPAFGHVVAFSSYASNLVPDDATDDVVSA